MSGFETLGGCEVIVPFPAAKYVQILLQVEERLFTQPGKVHTRWGVVRKDCGHFSAYVQVGEERRQFKPCFYEVAKAAKFTDECGHAYQQLMAERGNKTARYSSN